MDSIDSKLQRVRSGFQSFKTLPLAYRQAQLRAFRSALQNHYSNINDALAADLNRSSAMSRVSETEHLIDQVDYVLEHLNGWAAAEQREFPVMMLPANAYITYEPLGVVLIMGSWNFPFAVTLGPLIYAIAAGNAAIIKPSELSETSSKLIETLCSSLDPECYQVVQGGPVEAEHLLTLKWDLIFFTGSSEKGKIVAAAGAKTLTPVIGELGGKNPTIVDEDASVNSAALRIVQGRTFNVGQLCVGPEYVFVHKSLIERFEKAVIAAIQRFYGEDAKESPDYGRIITTGHTERIERLLQTHGGQVVYGGKVDVAERFVSPTLIRSPDLNSALMKEENFAPILAVFPFEDITEAITYINSKDKPLAVYYFGSRNKKLVSERTSSGAFLQNETIFQYALLDLPFGGVGASGSGRYHGVEGFRAMSNVKSVFEKDTYDGYPISLRYPPHTKERENLFLSLKHATDFSTTHLKSMIFNAAIASAVVYAVHKGYITKKTLTDARDAALSGLKRLKSLVVKD